MNRLQTIQKLTAEIQRLEASLQREIQPVLLGEIVLNEDSRRSYGMSALLGIPTFSKVSGELGIDLVMSLGETEEEVLSGEKHTVLVSLGIDEVDALLGFYKSFRGPAMPEIIVKTGR